MAGNIVCNSGYCAADKNPDDPALVVNFVFDDAQYPELQTIFPGKFRRDKHIQTYRITSAGNVYAYVYGGQSRPIYIGNWRESYVFNHPPAYQPANPHGTTPRPVPVSTQLGPTP